MRLTKRAVEEARAAGAQEARERVLCDVCDEVAEAFYESHGIFGEGRAQFCRAHNPGCPFCVPDDDPPFVDAAEDAEEAERVARARGDR